MSQSEQILAATVPAATGRRATEADAAVGGLLELVPVPSWICEAASHRVMAANGAALQAYGRGREEFLGLEAGLLCLPEERDRFRRFLDETATGPAAGAEKKSSAEAGRRWVQRRKDGSLLTVELQAHAFRHGGRDAVLVFARDVTDELRALAALRFGQERFSLIASATSDAIWDWDLASDGLWWSESFRTLFGYSAGGGSHSFDSWAQAVHPDDRERVVRSILRCRDQATDTWREEYRFRRADGSYATVLDRARLVRDSHGAPYRMVGGMTDITEQSRLQAQFMRTQRVESMGTLAGGIAHDLNNLLGPVLLALDLLRPHVADPEGLRLLTTVESCARGGADLVRHVLAFARGGDGKRQPIQLRNLVREAARFASDTFPRHIAVQADIASDLWTVEVDHRQINQVLLNLALNARDAMSGGGRVTFSAQNDEVEQIPAGAGDSAAPGPHVKISVADTGTGIAPENLSRLFEPFFTTKEVGQGTGLGLSTVRSIVRDHRGFILIDNTLGKGAVFHVYLPAIPELQPVEDAPVSAVSLRGEGRTLLLIEDEPALRDLTRHTLERNDYRVLAAVDGPEGVALLAQHRDEIALAITDMVLPIMDGEAIISALRRIKPGLPVVMTSGQEPFGRQAAGVQDKTRRFLPKPYTPAELLAAVASCLGQVSRPL